MFVGQSSRWKSKGVLLLWWRQPKAALCHRSSSFWSSKQVQDLPKHTIRRLKCIIIQKYVCPFYIEVHWVWHCKQTNEGKHFITRKRFLVVVMGDFNDLSNVTSLSWDACVFLYNRLFFFFLQIMCIKTILYLLLFLFLFTADSSDLVVSGTQLRSLPRLG